MVTHTMAALQEALSSIPSTHMVLHCSLCSPMESGALFWGADIQANETPVYIKYILKSSWHSLFIKYEQG